MALLNEHWSEAAARLTAQGEPYALATVIATTGSTPRDHGSKMLISGEHCFASIGGGQLEFLVIQRARELIAAGTQCQEMKQFPLAAEARQCCGGSVTILLECFAGYAEELVIFGAGHVARALIGIVSELDYRITLIDPRAELLDLPPQSRLRQQHSAAPETLIGTLPKHSQVLVMTHDHALDYTLISTLLEQEHPGFIGLIGSATKARRFRMRLAKAGYRAEDIDRLQCPVGLPAVKGKRPMAVAVSIAAQLISLAPAQDKRSDLPSWKQMKGLLAQAGTEEPT